MLDPVARVSVSERLHGEMVSQVLCRVQQPDTAAASAVHEALEEFLPVFQAILDLRQLTPEELVNV